MKINMKQIVILIVLKNEDSRPSYETTRKDKTRKYDCLKKTRNERNLPCIKAEAMEGCYLKFQVFFIECVFAIEKLKMWK